MMDILSLDLKELSASQLFDILKLRQDVFFVEENIIYPDLDNIDREAVHVFAMVDEDGGDVVGSYARVYLDHDEGRVKIGRVATARKYRGQGLGGAIIDKCVKIGKKRLGADEIWLDAQIHAVSFYEEQGFKIASERFIEAGIEHVRMVRK